VAHAYNISLAVVRLNTTYRLSYNKQNNANSTKYATVVGGCSGEDNICAMWREHFSKLYKTSATA